jgi:hypothetical protein
VEDCAPIIWGHTQSAQVGPSDHGFREATISKHEEFTPFVAYKNFENKNVDTAIF